MRGLVLNNLYSVAGSIKLALFITLAINLLFVLTGDSAGASGPIMVSIALLPATAFSLIKQDNSAGWDKYEITLPVRRFTIILSKYLTFILLLLASFILTFGLYQIFNSFAPSPPASLFNGILRGIGFVLCSASLTYVLSYLLGPEKGDILMLLSFGFAIAVFGGTFAVQNMFTETVVDEAFSIIYLFISVVLFILSFLLNGYIYKRKEF